MLLKLVKCGNGKLSKKRKKDLTEAVGICEAYLVTGYPAPITWATIMQWWLDCERNEREELNFQNTFHPKL